jgi:hypothetical protein
MTGGSYQWKLEIDKSRDDFRLFLGIGHPGKNNTDDGRLLGEDSGFAGIKFSCQTYSSASYEVYKSGGVSGSQYSCSPNSVSTVTLTLKIGQSLSLSTDTGINVAILNSTDLATYTNGCILVAGVYGDVSMKLISVTNI